MKSRLDWLRTFENNQQLKCGCELMRKKCFTKPDELISCWFQPWPAARFEAAVKKNILLLIYGIFSWHRFDNKTTAVNNLHFSSIRGSSRVACISSDCPSFRGHICFLCVHYPDEPAGWSRSIRYPGFIQICQITPTITTGKFRDLKG